MSKKDPTLPVKIGCDPEFGLVSEGSYRPLSPFIGEDGYHYEIRPMPHEDPLKVVQNIGRCIKGAYNRSDEVMDQTVKIYDDYSGGAGGHIHLDVHWKNFNDIKNALDIFIGIPVKLCEPVKQAGERLNDDGYGAFGDIRINSHGLEYRTPGTFLASRLYTSCVLSLAKVVAEEYQRTQSLGKLCGKSLNFIEILDKIKIARYTSDIYNSYISYSSLINSIKEYKDPIFNRIKEFKEYNSYSYYINILFRKFVTHKKRVTGKILSGWNIHKPKAATEDRPYFYVGG